MGKKGMIVAMVGVLLLLSLFGWLFMRSRSSTNETVDTTEEVFVTTAPEPTEEPDFELSDFSIQILNGSGVAGLAGTLQSSLEEAGFTVDSTGNADNYNYQTTVIQAKESVPQGYIDQLAQTLEETYDAVTVETLDDTEGTDVVVIIGGQQSEVTEDTEDEETDTPTPTEVEEEETPTPTPDE